MGRTGWAEVAPGFSVPLAAPCSGAGAGAGGSSLQHNSSATPARVESLLTGRFQEAGPEQPFTSVTWFIRGPQTTPTAVTDKHNRIIMISLEQFEFSVRGS